MTWSIRQVPTWFRPRWHDDDGAVTVDWVVLTAAIIGITFGALSQISGATTSLGTRISSGIADDSVGGLD